MTTTVTLPDLWLKIDLALGLLPSGTPMDCVDNGALARCARGDGGRATTLNQWMAGDNALRIADDLHHLAATLETLIAKGVPAKADVSRSDWAAHAVRDYASQVSSLALEKVLLGTVPEFGAALVDLVGGRADFLDRGGRKNFERVLDDIVRRALLETLPNVSDPAGTIAILHGPSRHWLGSERIARKHAASPDPIPEGDFIQFVVPPAPIDQLVMGFELRTDTSLIDTEWEDMAGWFPPRMQRSGMALMLLPETVDVSTVWRAEVPGTFELQLVAIPIGKHDAPVDHGAEAPLPDDLRRLTLRRPSTMPDGYAETMAFLTYIKRLDVASRRAGAAAQGEAHAAASRAPSGAFGRPKLYQGTYSVAARDV